VGTNMGEDCPKCGHTAHAGMCRVRVLVLPSNVTQVCGCDYGIQADAHPSFPAIHADDAPAPPLDPVETLREAMKAVSKDPEHTRNTRRLVQTKLLDAIGHLNKLDTTFDRPRFLRSPRRSYRRNRGQNG
jgi:hypothetical protein